MGDEAPAVCSSCGRALEPEDLHNCPSCGDTRVTHRKSVRVKATGTPSLAIQVTHEVWVTERPLLITVIALTVAVPFLGLVLPGWPGVVVGIVAGVGLLVLGFRVRTKVREIHDWREP